MHLLIKIDENQPEEVKGILRQYYGNYKKKFPTDSGLDLVVPQHFYLKPKTMTLMNLGICCAPISDKPHGYYLYPRSSLSKTGLRLANSVGIIDQTYRGPITAAVDNITNGELEVEAGTKLFQICAPDLSPFTIELVETLDTTERGSGAYGSTN